MRGDKNYPSIIKRAGLFQFTPLREGRPGHHRPAGAQPADFNSRPYVRGDCWPRARTMWNSIFQFTPLREGRRLPGGRHRGADHFNSRPYVRGDSTTARRPTSRANFNSRPYVRGDDFRRKAWNGLRKFQFTPLREGRRAERAAATVSATNFNSRPYVRGDRECLRLLLKIRYFNSRPYVRGDIRMEFNQKRIQKISIHAPT